MITIAVWALTGASLIHTLIGPRRWFERLSSQVRPDRAAPTATGYRWLKRRNVVVTVLLVSVAGWWTLDGARVSQAEWEETVGTVVVGLSGSIDAYHEASVPGTLIVNGDTIDHELEEQHGGSVVVLRVTDGESLSGRQWMPEFYEVSPGSRKPGNEPLRGRDGGGDASVATNDDRSLGSARVSYGRGNRPTVCLVVEFWRSDHSVASVTGYPGLCPDTEAWKARNEEP